MVGIWLIATSCATTYHTISPKTLPYVGLNSQDAVAAGYRHHLLLESYNKRYYRKATKNNLSLVAVKVVNQTNRPVVVQRDVALLQSGKKLQIVEREAVYKTLKQHLIGYFLYALQPRISEKYDYPLEIDRIPIGVPIGFVNIAIGFKANRSFEEELINHDLVNRQIQPGETFYGIIGIKDSDFGPITLQFIDLE